MLLQTIAESDEEDPHAIQLNGEDSNAEDAEVDEATGRQSRAQPGRKLQPSSVKLEARKAAQDEQAARVALKQQRRDIENLSGTGSPHSCMVGVCRRSGWQLGKSINGCDLLHGHTTS